MSCECVYKDGLYVSVFESSQWTLTIIKFFLLKYCDILSRLKGQSFIM